VVTSSIDTTCIVWDLDTSAVTHWIAHDRDVYDVVRLPSSTNLFVSAESRRLAGGVRHAEPRTQAQSMILYETPPPKSRDQPRTRSRPSSPLLRIPFDLSESSYKNTFQEDGTDVQSLDMRSSSAS
jgi:DDB1- and CUL4-associated factor 7